MIFRTDSQKNQVSQEQAEVEADVQAKPNVAIRNPNFVDPGMETDNEYNKTHEMTREEVSQQFSTASSYKSNL